MIINGKKAENMRTEQEMFSLILDFAQSDERIRLVGMEGSRTNVNIPKDSFQDYDISFLATDMESFKQDDKWLDIFGERIIMQKPEDMELSPPEAGKLVFLFDAFPGWNENRFNPDSLRRAGLIYGSTSDVMEAAKQIVPNSKFDNQSWLSLKSTSNFTTGVKNQIVNSKHPVLISFFHTKPPYNDTNNPGIGHACVVYGMDNSTGKYYIYDPYYTYAGSNNKITLSLTQGSFMNGFILSTWDSSTWYGGTVITY